MESLGFHGIGRISIESKGVAWNRHEFNGIKKICIGSIGLWLNQQDFVWKWQDHNGIHRIGMGSTGS